MLRLAWVFDLLRNRKPTTGMSPRIGGCARLRVFVSRMRPASTAVLPSRTHVRLEAGFQPGWIYRLQYTASEPLILGLGQIVVRDLVDFFRRRPADDRGTANPLAGTVDISIDILQRLRSRAGLSEPLLKSPRVSR